MTIWFFSDPHFDHENIWAKFKKPDGSPVRPFTSTEEMNETIIENINSVVKPGDHLYCMGDVAMSKEGIKLVSRLNGRKRLLFGNHDIYAIKEYQAAGFEKFGSVRRFDGVVFSHYPLHESTLFPASVLGNAHGHIHTLPAPTPRHLNLSVEQTNYGPVALETVVAQIRRQRELAGV